MTYVRTGNKCESENKRSNEGMKGIRGGKGNEITQNNFIS